jgi:hypothetical protein
MVSGYEIRQAGGLAQGCNIILRSQAGRQVYTLNPDLLLKLEFTEARFKAENVSAEGR